MAKMSYSTLFKGIRKGGLTWAKIDRNDAQGWSMLLHGEHFEGGFTYTGENDRTMMQKVKEAAKFPNVEEQDVTPTRAQMEAPLTEEASSIDFLRAWAYCEPAQSNDSTRYNLCAVALDEGTMVATDGHRLNSYPNAFPKELDGQPVPTLILPREANGLMARCLLFALNEGVTSYKLGLDTKANTLRFQIDSPSLKADVKMRLVDGQFPQWRDVIPTFDLNECVRITGNVGLLAAALKTAPVMLLSSKGKRLTFGIEGDGSVWVLDEEGKPDARPLPIHADGWHNEERRLVIHFEKDYLLEAFDGDGEFRLMLGTDGLTPLRWEQGDALGVIMPMRG